DIDETFKSEDVYHKYFIQSCEVFNDSIKADLIVSKYLLEHVPDNSKTFKNIEGWLNQNGQSVNLFPLGFHPFSIANRIVGNKMARFLIPILRPGSEGVTGYPAYYNLCNSFALEKLASKSKSNYKIKYFFGAEDYFGFFFPFGILVHVLNRIFHLFRLNIFASNAVLVISK
ncbi:class I SAM-dependent methyltransferase, partial [Schleiferiaceae bacterium]|nr:class I SAM-dependent methyltransferase [Schleiferiaceae bacterium]